MFGSHLLSVTSMRQGQGGSWTPAADVKVDQKSVADPKGCFWKARWTFIVRLLAYLRHRWWTTIFTRCDLVLQIHHFLRVSCTLHSFLYIGKHHWKLFNTVTFEFPYRSAPIGVGWNSDTTRSVAITYWRRVVRDQYMLDMYVNCYCIYIDYCIKCWHMLMFDTA